MTDNTQPETREFTMSQYASKDDMIAAMHARIAEMETQLEAIGAGGVSGPLMGQPQAMPGLSQLTERGAQAWAGVDAQELREGFTAADMATASAQGFRDGAASVSANVGSEPVALGAWDNLKQMMMWSAFGGVLQLDDALANIDEFAGLHPSPPEGMVTVPKEPTRSMQIAAKRADMDHSSLADWLVSDWPEFKRIWDAMIAAAPPTSSADSKGE